MPDESRGKDELIAEWEAEGEQELVPHQHHMGVAERRRWNAFTQDVIRKLPHDKLLADVMATYLLLHAVHRELSRSGH